jgi:hypothetical protein
MRTLILEIRDRATFFLAIAVEMKPSNEEQRYLLRRAGYDLSQYTIDSPLSSIMFMHAVARGGAKHDPYDWSDRTYKVAHAYIEKHWHGLKDGDVIDVEFILGETSEPKKAQRFEVPL